MNNKILKDLLKFLKEMETIKGDYVIFENETYYKISNSDAMRPFFMCIVSDSNHWMFVSSNGGLSAGRKNAEASVFPYYTDDKITEGADITGSKTLFQIQLNDDINIWEPFSIRQAGLYKIIRNLYKNSSGNPGPQFATITQANTWTEVSIVFTGIPGNNTGLNQLVIKPNNPDGTDGQTTTAEGVYYFDDIRLE